MEDELFEKVWPRELAISGISVISVLFRFRCLMLVAGDFPAILRTIDQTQRAPTAVRGQDGAGRSLPAMPTAGEMQNLSPSSGSALLPRKGHLSRVSAQNDENTRSACCGQGRQRNHYTDIILRHIL